MGQGKARRKGMGSRTGTVQPRSTPATRALAPSTTACDLDQPWRSNCASGYKGVTQMVGSRKTVGKFRAGFADTILGYFDTALEAAMALTHHPPAREYRRIQAERQSWLGEAAMVRMTLKDAKWHALKEGLTLTPANNTAGYRGVTVDGRKELPYIVYHQKQLLGRFWTAHEASLCYERHRAQVTAEEAEAGRGGTSAGASSSALDESSAVANVPMSREQAEQLAAAEGVRLIEAPGTITGYKGVRVKECKDGSSTFYAHMTIAGATYRVGHGHSSAPEAALTLARCPHFSAKHSGHPQDAAQPEGGGAPVEECDRSRRAKLRLNEDKRIALLDEHESGGGAPRSIHDPPPFRAPAGVGDGAAAGSPAREGTRARTLAEAALPADARRAKRQAFAPPECAICMEGLAARAWGETPCGHSFHVDCLQQWLQLHVSCPQCRHTYKARPKFVSTRRAFVAIHEPPGARE